MGGSVATVLVPTRSHATTLRHSVATALRQTVRDLEVLLVLDGADEATSRVADELAEADGRVRALAFPKGERHGEANRHAALERAQGGVVLYLSDDDLWFPDHVERMAAALQDADFCSAHALLVTPDGGIEMPFVGDLRDAWYRDELQGRRNFIPLSAGGHTLAAYRRLPVGWSPAPPDLWTDLHMWQKFAILPGARFASTGVPTVLVLPSHPRATMTAAERGDEMARWRQRLEEPGGWNRLRLEATEAMAHRVAELNKQVEILYSERAAVDQMRSDAERAWRELAAVQGSVAYRAARRLATIPIMGRAARWVGKRLAR